MSINNYTVFDVVTANSSTASICSIGIVKVENNKIVFKNEYLINPEAEFSPINVRIHNITPEMVKDQPTFPIVWNEIKEYFMHSVLIAHNAKSMDLCALYKTLDRYNIPNFEINYICTYELSKKIFRYYEVPSYSLNSICVKLGILLNNHHNALNDALACYSILEYFNKNYPDFVLEQKYLPKWKNKQAINKNNLLEQECNLPIKETHNYLLSLLFNSELSAKDEKRVFNTLTIFIRPSNKNNNANIILEFLKINKISLEDRLKISLDCVNYLRTSNKITEHQERKLKKIIHYYIWEIIELFE